MVILPCSARRSEAPHSGLEPFVGKVLFATALLVTLATPATGQSTWPLSVAAGTHSLTVPWHLGPVNDRLNGVFVIGTDRSLREGSSWRFYHTANIGYFQHHWWISGLFMDGELGIGRRLALGTHADLRLGIGYLHYFLRRETLELENGEYVSATDWGRPSIIVPLSLLVGYQGGSHENRVEPFLSAQWIVQGVFKPEIPALTHLLLLLGARIRLESLPVGGGS
jgi:hypothetical protein